MWSFVVLISSMVILAAAAPQDIANAAGVAGDAGVDVAANGGISAAEGATAGVEAPVPAPAQVEASAGAAGRTPVTAGAAGAVQADVPTGRALPTSNIGQQAYSGAANQPLVQEVARSAIVNADGSFNYSYDLSNGVHVEEVGYVKRDPGAAARLRDASVSELTEDTGEINVAEGAFSYTAPDGTHISLRYIADENGFQPQGDHLPTPHPAIQRALAAIAAGELDDGDDGSYRPSVHGQVRPADELTGRSANGGAGSIAAEGAAVAFSSAAPLPALVVSTAAPALIETASAASAVSPAGNGGAVAVAPAVETVVAAPVEPASAASTAAEGHSE